MIYLPGYKLIQNTKETSTLRFIIIPIPGSYAISARIRHGKVEVTKDQNPADFSHGMASTGGQMRGSLLFNNI